MLPSLKQLREAAGGLPNLTDEEILSATYPAYQQYYGSVDDFAKAVGYEGAGRGMASSRISAGIDNYQAGLLGLGGAVSRAVGLDGAADWFDRRREANEQSAAYATQRARDLGAVDDWREVDGFGSGLNFVGGLAAQSLPYLGEAAVGGLAARGLATGARAALRGATTAEEAAAAGRRLGAIQTGGAVTASYPSAVGDILANQREAGGEDLGSALLGGVPYAALNAFGVEGLAARGFRPLAAGQGGLARRTATGAGVTALGEGLGETGQEMANQYFGRMAVDPNETLFSDEAQARYLDSFVGGAALGGLFGGVGGIRRPRTVDQGQFDMTRREDQGDPLQLGFSPLAGTPVVFPDGSVALNSEQELQRRYGVAPEPTTIPDMDMGEGVANTQQLGNTPTDSAAPKAPVISQFDEVDQGLTDMGIPMASGKKTREKQRAFYQDAVATGIPLDSDLLTPYWTAVSQNRFGDKTKVLLQNAIVQSKKDAANVSTPSAPVGQPVAGSVGRSAAPVGGVGNRGSVPDVVQPDGGNAGNTQPAGGQAAPVANAGVQPAAPVGENTSILAGANPATPPVAQRAAAPAAAPDPFQVSDQPASDQPASGEPVVQRKKRVAVTPTAPQAGYVAPEIAPQVEAADPVAQTWDDHKDDNAGDFGALPPNQQQIWRDAVAAKAAGKPVNLYKIAEDLSSDTDEGTGETIRDTINQIFDGRDADIINAFYVEKLTTAQIAEKYGLSRSRVSQIAGEGKVAQDYRNKRIAAAQQKYGWTDEYVRSLMGEFGETATGETVEDGFQSQSAPGIEDDNSQDRDIASLGVEGELTLGDVGMSTISSEGGSTGYKDTIGNRVKTLSKEQIDKLNNLRDELAQLEKDRAKAQQDGDEELAQSYADYMESVQAKIDKLESGKAAPQELAASISQEWFENTAKADELEARIAAAIEAGLSTLTEKSGKQSLDEAQKRVDALRAEADKLLAKAQEILQGAKAPAAETKTEPKPKKESKPKAPKAEKPAAPTASQQDSGQKLWESLRAQSPNLVTYEELTNNERGYLTELADRTGGKPVIKNELGLQELMGRTSDMKFGKGKDNAKVTNPYTADELLSEIKKFVRSDIPGRKLLVVNTIADLLRHPDKSVRAAGAAIALNNAYGVAANGRAFLIADRIEKGRGRAKFMHEVGSHLGLEGLLPKALYDKLTKQIVEWAKKDDGSIESELAQNAAERVMNAGTPKEDQRSEMLAYFLEEAVQAGIDPTATTKESGPLRDWFRTLWAAFKVAVRKLGFKPESMEAVDVVNMAFGAARLEIAGTWHGTAAAFRKFNHKFMGTGEGAQAYGWGTYLAQRTGIAKGYWQADVKRKGGVDEDNPAYKVGGKTYSYSDGASDQAQVEYLAAELLASPTFLRTANAQEDGPYKDAIALARKWQSEGKTSSLASTTPDGSLMRVDTSVPEAEMLDWDEPLSKQPKVLERIGMYMHKGLQEAVADQFQTNVDDIGGLTGEDLYNALRFLEREQGLVSEFWGTDEYVGKSAKRTASLYLDSMGVGGLKFLDAKSRGPSGTILADGQDVWDSIHYAAWGALANAKGDLAEAMESISEQIDAAVAEGATYRLDDLEESLSDLKSLRGKDIEFKEKVRTKNIVIFDDKNIFRVGSEAAADRQRMKFGKESSVPAAVKPQVEGLTKVLKVAKDAALNTIVFSEDLFKRAASMGIDAAMDMDRIYRERAALTGNIEREVTRIENLFNRIPAAFKGTGPNSANRLLYDMTREGKWGFAPKWRGADATKVTIDAGMANRFKALPKEAQEWVRSVLEHGDKMLKLKKDTLIDSTNSEYDALIADARSRGENDKATKLEKDKAASLRQFQRLFSVNEFKPYAPMRRFGNWVVSAKSQEYMDAVTAGDRAKVAELEKDPDHYHVSFAESYASALELQRELKAEGHFASVPDPREKEKSRLDMYGGLMSAFNQLRENIESELGGATDPSEIKALRAARETVIEMYLQSLAENSARKAEMRRRGVAGEIDMLRSFSTQGRADAHFLAASKFNPQTSQAVVKMRQQKNAPGNETEKSMAFNEVMARHEQSMKYEDGGWFDVANKASRVTSIWMLATSPMYYLQNLTQPFMLSLPFMAGRHDYTAAAGQLMRSYFQLGALLKSAKLGEGFDFTKVSNDKDEQAMVLKLVDRGRIDIGMDTELGRVKLEGDGVASKAVNRGDQILRSLSQKVEAINRVSTALAAYRLERKNGASPEAALEYADQVISQTHGDYTRINAPRAFNTPVGKVALQFRKFQLIQLTLLAKLVHNSFKGASPEERAAARKILTFTMAHTGVLAGVVGMPGFAAAAFVINKLADAFGDDDEPYNLENELRKMLGGGDLAQAVMRGAPNLAGTDFSGKLGMGNALSILPYTDFDASREGFNAIATGLTLGATGGLGARVFQALGDIKDGDYYRGLMGLSPALLANSIRAYVENTRGETNRRGDVLVSADEISNWESFAKVIGWPTSNVSERRFDRQVAYDNKEAFENKASKLKNEYSRAVRENDAEARRSAIEKWQRLQKSRREAGFQPQPLSALMKAPQQQRQRERNTAGGVQFNRQNRGFVMEQTQ